MIEPAPLLLPPPSKKKSHLMAIAIIALVVCIAIASFGILGRLHEEQNLKRETEAEAIPTVAVITAEPGAASEEIVLPGTVEAWHEAVIYARTTGYIKSWSADIGAHVKEGDVLAEIDAPDLDAQYHQAQADLNTSLANNDLAQKTAKRNVELRKTDSVSQQTADQALATAAADQAAVDSQNANLDHLQQEENFKKVTAPFDGTITKRNTDVGALVNGGNDGTSTLGQDLFHIAQTDKLRVYIQVPENDAAAITPNLTAELHFPQNPQQTTIAKLFHTADALDPKTRALLIELEVDNADASLLSGGYTDAHIKLPTDKSTILLPVNALLFRDTERAAIVVNNHVALKEVTIGRDYGKLVEITSGLSAGDQVVINPPDSLGDGNEVRVVTPKKEDQK